MPKLRSSINKRIGNNTSDRGKGAEQKRNDSQRNTERKERRGKKEEEKRGRKKEGEKRRKKIKVKQRAQPVFYPGLKFLNTYFKSKIRYKQTSSKSQTRSGKRGDIRKSKWCPEKNGHKRRGKREKAEKEREKRGKREASQPRAKPKFYPGQTFWNTCVNAEFQYKFTNC